MKQALALAASLLAALLTAPAQTTVTGSFVGVVVDGSTRARLPGAKVEVKNLDLGLRYVRHTDAEGRFTVGSLPPGNYEVRLSAPGFAEKLLTQRLYPGRANDLLPIPVELRPEQAAADAPAPTRVFKDGVLTSKEQPAVRVRVGKGFKYVGAQSFVLYGVANAEQHFFVDADRDGRVRRLYWVQFEGYLPTNNHAYQYKGTKTVNVGGLDFIADSQARNIDASAPRPDSDGARARAFLAAKGYRMASSEMLWQRLVHLTDETKRNELMFIYLEDLTPTGLTSADLAPGGKAAARWDELSRKLLERAVGGLKIERIGGPTPGGGR